MKTPLSDRLAAAVFVLSIVVLSVVYGAVASVRGWFPAPQIELAHDTIVDLALFWRNDLGLAPTRHLVPAAENDPDRGYRPAPGAEPTPGFVLVTTLGDDQTNSSHLVQMFDDGGREVHRWPVRYESFDDEMSPRNVVLHGMEVFEDGSLAVTFDVGNAIARIDACGEPMWVVNGNYHHSIARDGEGALVTWRDEAIVRLNEETGEELSVLDIRRDVIPAAENEQRGYLELRTVSLEEVGDRTVYLEDPLHPNDAEALRAEMAVAFPMFAPGDILFSLREINLIAVADPATGRLKWWHHGPWIKQHDPDFQPDGTITVYDNGTSTGRSLIRRIDPADGRLSVVFEGGAEEPFYSWRRGKHQVLPGGNLLLTEAERGRVLEVDPRGRLVWERHLPWDADRNLVVTEARHVPETFFGGDLPDCRTQDAGPEGGGD
ncbi:MAG: arylsulfotransferase family protein [Pseudomonadota bacterium]|uniref:arylsulfotransferase family protein n=1 Tax=Roseovarius salincola TaxID=2978479 RepID=UPI0022A82086|nr:arylsulfotransferase family protein [Roseovarius sp. EGI FJ00037]MCZ0814344.1 PQQ-binding-like beta-propeller repeat protein [Roseovarius sp. EGI FJ00037]